VRIGGPVGGNETGTQVMKKIRGGWSPTMAARTLEGVQVKCLTADEGHVWMGSYDRLPLAVRRRLAASDFNICPAMTGEARTVTRHPSIATYFAVIESIERKLAQD
jgi:hypothetical protein